MDSRTASTALAASPFPSPLFSATRSTNSFFVTTFPPCRGQLTGRNVTMHPDESSPNSAPGAERAASSEPFRRSGARNGHFTDQDRRRLYAAAKRYPAQLGAHGTHCFKHCDEIAGDRQLAHRGAQLASLDQPAGGPHGEGSGHRIDA